MLVDYINDREACRIQFAQQMIILYTQGALFIPEKKLLVVSDLHLEKGSFLAKYGQHPLPVYDTAETIYRLQILIDRLKPQALLCLGDNLHDTQAIARMRPSDYEQLYLLCKSVPDWQWIIGNHDPINLQDKLFQDFKVQTRYTHDSITFTHELIDDAAFQIVGHFHPKMRLQVGAKKIYGKCFCVTENILFMPAFGAYTGGLDVQSDAFQAILKSYRNTHYYFLKQNKIWFIQ